MCTLGCHLKSSPTVNLYLCKMVFQCTLSWQKNVIISAQSCTGAWQIMWSLFQELNTNSNSSKRTFGIVWTPYEWLLAFFYLHYLFSSFYSFQYIKMRTQKISVVLKKRFTAPNWVKVSIIQIFNSLQKASVLAKSYSLSYFNHFFYSTKNPEKYICLSISFFKR